MSDALPTLQTSVIRSSEFRRVHSNITKYRIGQGEITVVFSSATEVPNSPSPFTIVEEAEVSMTWIQAKILRDSLTSALKAVEAQFGKIPEAQKILPEVEFERQNEAAVKNLGLITT